MLARARAGVVLSHTQEEVADMKTINVKRTLAQLSIATGLAAVASIASANCGGDVALQLLDNTSQHSAASRDRDVLIWLRGKPVGYVGSSAQLNSDLERQLGLGGQELSFVALTGPEGMVRTLGGSSKGELDQQVGAMLPTSLDEFSTVVAGQDFALQVRSGAQDKRNQLSYRFISSGVSVQFNDQSQPLTTQIPTTEFASMVVQELMPRSEIVAKNVSVRLQANVQPYADKREDTMCIELAALDTFGSVK